MIPVILFILGLSLGSFLNVVALRWGSNQSWVQGRSQCPKCSRTLQWYELLPLVSFVFLRGKCRTCHAPISWKYPFVECITGVLVVAWWYQFQGMLSFQSGAFLFAILSFFLLASIDYLYFLLPDVFIGLLFILTLVIHLSVRPTLLLHYALTGLLLSFIFAILYIVSRGRWIGFGDVKLIALIGFMFGYPLGYLVVIVAVWIATAIGLGLVISKRATLKTALPFGVFLSFVSIVAILFLNEIQFLNRFFL